MQVKNLVVGKNYTTRDGQEKTKWTTIGAVFIKPDGKISIKIEQIPLNWDGQAQVSDRDNQTQAPQQGYGQPQQPQQPQSVQYDADGNVIPI
ncbi:hypothetical protein DRJ25_03955 [Candidatus Woesearchaeota archaeon]|nr:MAG: hypothetical protein DRJ25_03955 [Candidatus Woesearchaeota archaeon]